MTTYNPQNRPPGFNAALYEARGKAEPEELQRECGGKRQHVTLDKAKHVARILRSKNGDNVHAYLCRFCGFYHVGHKSAAHKGDPLAMPEGVKLCSDCRFHSGGRCFSGKAPVDIKMKRNNPIDKCGPNGRLWEEAVNPGDIVKYLPPRPKTDSDDYKAPAAVSKEIQDINRLHLHMTWWILGAMAFNAICTAISTAISTALFILQYIRRSH